MLLRVSSDSMAAVVFPSAETAVPVKVLKTPVGSMSSYAIRPTTSTTNGKTMREIAEALDETLLQKDGWLEHEDSSDGCGGGGLPKCGDYGARHHGSDATLLAAVKAHSRVP